MTVHFLNCFTCNARYPSEMKTSMLCLLAETAQGLVLVDTGLGLGDYKDPSPIVRLMRVITVMPFDEREAAIHRVRGLGYDPKDVRHIVLTHMHFDHCGGLGDFPHARVHVHRREYEAFTDNRILHWDEFAYVPRHIAHRPEFILYDEAREKWFGFDAIRLPFDPEAYLIPLHGHSRGHCGVALKTASSWIFHIGDAGAVYNDVSPQWLIRWALGPYDPLLRAFMKDRPDILVATSHIFPEFIEAHPSA